METTEEDFEKVSNEEGNPASSTDTNVENADDKKAEEDELGGTRSRDGSGRRSPGQQTPPVDTSTPSVGRSTPNEGTTPTNDPEPTSDQGMTSSEVNDDDKVATPIERTTPSPSGTALTDERTTPTPMSNRESSNVDIGKDSTDGKAVKPVDQVEPPPEEKTEEEQPNTYVINDLESINQKRQEEKVVFQKLIDDITQLEHTVKEKQKVCDELQMKYDVCALELDGEKEKSGETRTKLNDLQKKLLEAEEQLAKAKRREQDALAAGNSAVPVEDPDEIRELHQKIKKLTHDDELKTQKVAQLESELAEHNQLIARLESEVGKEKMEALRLNGHSNGVAHGHEKERSRSNAVGPEVQQSSVCIIL